jgi:hypothetical protein
VQPASGAAVVVFAVGRLVEAATLEAMKRDGKLLPGLASDLFEGGFDCFLFEGWIEHGRLVAGDPRTAPD